MTRFGSADVAFMLVNGMSILGQQTEFEDSREAVLEAVTVLGNANEEHQYVGVKSYECSQKGYYDDTANGNNAALVGAGGTKVYSIGLEGNTKGQIVICTTLAEVEYRRQIQRRELHKAAATYKAMYGHDEARILHALAARTADGDTEATYYDGLAGSSAGGTGYLQVTALTLDGYDDLLVTIEDSTDHASWASLLSFTAATGITGERKAVSGTVDRYLAVSWEFEGAGTSPSATFMVGFGRN